MRNVTLVALPVLVACGCLPVDTRPPPGRAVVTVSSDDTADGFTTDDGWRVDVPLPGVDPKDVSLEVAGNNLTIRAEVPSEDKEDTNVSRYEQTLMIPQFLDLEKLTASHRHGMLRLTVPLKESVKPRRIQIETQVEDQKQLVGAR